MNQGVAQEDSKVSVSSNGASLTTQATTEEDKRESSMSEDDVWAGSNFENSRAGQGE